MEEIKPGDIMAEENWEEGWKEEDWEIVKITECPKWGSKLEIKFREGEYEISDEIREGVIIDFDKNNEILGIEIPDAKTRLSPSSVAEMSFKFSKNPFLKRKRLRKETKEGIKV